MKKLLIVMMGLMMSIAGWTQQFIHASVQQGSSPNKINILFRPEYTNTGTEALNYLQFAIAVPATGNAALTPVLTPVGSYFTGASFVPQATYNFNGERIFNWNYFNSAPAAMSWTTGVPFVGLTITFTGGAGPSKVRLVDFTNQVGDGNTLYIIGVNNSNDPTDYGNVFYAQGGLNSSTVGSYPGGDVYVETNLLITLPVSLLNFSGYKNGAKNTLNWTVANEASNKGFEVERSTDGVSYSSIGFVNSQVGGYTSREVHYTFDDNNPTGKKQYYRLNQKDFDGNGKLSNIVMLTRDKATQLGIGGLFPNPASDKINVIIEAPQRDNVTLIVTDMAGKMIKQQQASVDMGSNTIPVDIAKLAGGSYLVKVVCQSSDCDGATSKFNKQ